MATFEETVEGYVASLDEQIEALDTRLAKYDKLREQRDRLIAAKRALVGGPVSPRSNGGGGRGGVRREAIIEYVTENPGSRPVEIAQALGAPQSSVQSALYRGKGDLFVQRDGAWWVRDPKNGLNEAPEE